MQDNLVHATNSMRSSVGSLKRKLSGLRIKIEEFDAELNKIETKFDKVLTEAEIYKSKLERELGREVRRLEKELELAHKNAGIKADAPTASGEELKIASTILILESILRQICENAEDFRLLSYAFLFPGVIERVVSGEEEAYYLEEIPPSAHLVIQRGREYVNWLRSDCHVHVTDPVAWEKYATQVTDWWRNDALPLLYGSRDEQWDIDVPYTLLEMLNWRDNPSERPMQFSSLFDAYEIYKKNKDFVYETSGVRAFELKHFQFS